MRSHPNDRPEADPRKPLGDDVANATAADMENMEGQVQTSKAAKAMIPASEQSLPERLSDSQMLAKNARFYATLFAEYQWETPQLSTGVFVQTLNAIADEIERQQAERDAEWWDQHSVQCGNCSVQLVARGGPVTNHGKALLHANLGLSDAEGEDEALCGQCAGAQMYIYQDELDSLKAELERLRGEREQLLKAVKLCAEMNLVSYASTSTAKDAARDAPRQQGGGENGSTVEKS